MIERLALEEAATFMSRGVSPRYDEQGYIILNQRCIRDHRIEFKKARITSLHRTRVKPEKFIQQWDVLVNSTGVGTLGRVAQVITRMENVTVDSHITIVRPNLNILDGRYFGYALIYCEDHIKLLGTGTTGQTELSRQHLSEVRIPVHPFSMQHKIAAILSTYDNLIENNLRRIQILEEIAQTIYQKWFVNFRFPGHEKVQMIDSPLGKIPESWEIESLADSCDILMGQSPRSEFYNKVGEGLPFHQGVTSFESRFPIHRVYCTVEKRIAEVGDILLSVRAPVGRINIADKQLIVGRGLCAIRNHDGNRWLTFHQLKEKFKKEDTMGGGTIFKAITKQDVQNIAFLKPTNSIARKFEEICQPIETQIEILTRQNYNLRQTRDLLLPKLISGELNVERLEITTEELRK